MNTALKQQEDQFECFYQEWKRLVITGKAKTSLRPTKRFISQKGFVFGIKGIQKQASCWLERGCNEGFIQINPYWTHSRCGLAKYLVVGG